MKVRRDKVVTFLNEFLGIALVRDYGPQGLQVEGKETVSKVVTGVSCSLEFFEKAIQAGADMIVVHHGLLWDRDPRPIVGVLRRRLETLFDADINLLAYHLPLDAHQDLGHSAQIGKRLGLVEQSPFGEYQGLFLGVRGRFDTPLSMVELSKKVEVLFDQAPLVFAYGTDKVSTMAISSGGSADMVTQAVAQGIDCFLCGDPREPTQAYCRETGINFMAAGHYNTEKLGIIALGDLITEKFSLPVEFIDVPNPV